LPGGDFLPLPEAPRIADVICPAGLATFALSAGMVTHTYIRTGTTKATLTEEGRAWLRSRDPELLLAVFEQWVSQGAFDELARLSAVKGQRAGTTRLTLPSSRRERVVEALSWCPASVWIDVEEFFRAVLIWQFDFDVETSAGANLHIDSRGWPWWGYSYWRLVKCQYILVVLWEYLATLGLLDIIYTSPADAAYDPGMEHFRLPFYSLYDGLKYFRINPLGAYLLGQASSYHRESRPPAPFLQIGQPDPAREEFSVEVLQSDQITPDDLRKLEKLAQPAGGRAFTLDLSSLLAALAAGTDLQKEFEFVSQWHSGDVPEPVCELFQTAIGRGQAFLNPQPARIWETNSTEVAELVREDAKARRLCYPVDETKIVVPERRAAAFRKRLRELGYVLKE
jgi:hypothetical protein